MVAAGDVDEEDDGSFAIVEEPGMRSRTSNRDEELAEVGKIDPSLSLP